jgi:hypothetical protein
MTETRKIYNILEGKNLGANFRRQIFVGGNIKIDFKELGYDVCTGFIRLMRGTSRWLHWVFVFRGKKTDHEYLQQKKLLERKAIPWS